MVLNTLNGTMLMYKRLFVLFALLVSGFLGKTQQAQFPAPKGWINDFDHVFTQADSISLDSLAKACMQSINTLDTSFGLQIAVVSVTDSMMGEFADMLPYATELSIHWGVGKRGSNNGLMIAFCTQRRKLAIATGTNLQNLLTDKQCQTILDGILFPTFRKQNYVIGLSLALREIEHELRELLRTGKK